ncbi:MAG: cache domain-containing protein [Gammaproteobacteria bacterium]|nr:cache domain-containing protein [Gammaproteobacteria bacterium]
MLALLQRLFFGGSLRYKLLSLVLIPLLLLTGTLIYLTSTWTSNYTYQQLFTKVNTDLRVAHDGFVRIETDRQREIEFLADSAIFRAQLDSNSVEPMMDLLVSHRLEYGLDFLNLYRADGQRRLTRDGWLLQPLKVSPISDAVLHPSKSDQYFATGIEIYERDEWQQEPQIEADKVVLPLVETPRASPTTRTHEDRAMVIRVLRAVLDDSDQLIAVLEGGVLLNKNFGFVDEIRDLVYGPGSLAIGSRGTVTVFLDDVRITTNVPGSREDRALGTRVSTEVRNTVLQKGEQWIDRAFVVNDWYISAYEPIIDVNGNKVGMLYAGYLEAPFRSDMERAVTWLAGIALAGACIASMVAAIGAKTIFAPIEAIAVAVRATAQGKSRRIGALNTHDEVGELGEQFDSMLEALDEQRARIDQHTHELEEQVELRTAELQSKNDSLQESIHLLRTTREQLANAEKLAALGHLTAGVAHEINNPTAVILGNMEVLVADLGDAREKVDTEIDLIFEQVYRIRSITDKLLQYSRPNSFTPMEGDYDDEIHSLLRASAAELSDTSSLAKSAAMEVEINALVSDSIVLVQHELEQKQIVLDEKLMSVDRVRIDAQEFQQVMVNLLMNAIEAVEQAGHIEVSTSMAADGSVNVTVSDDGVGIEPKHLPQLFDPFFTSGKESGTGLGLSLSYSIVRRYGGRLEVSSTPMAGAQFEVFLPTVAPVGSHASNATVTVADEALEASAS